MIPTKDVVTAVVKHLSLSLASSCSNRTLKWLLVVLVLVLVVLLLQRVVFLMLFFYMKG